MSDPRRELLELLAFGADPEVRPADRLRALELLDQMTDEDDRALVFAREAVALDEAAVISWEDGFFSALLMKITRGDEQARAVYPGIAAALDHLVGERAREITARLRKDEPVFDTIPTTQEAEPATEDHLQPGLWLVAD